MPKRLQNARFLHFEVAWVYIQTGNVVLSHEINPAPAVQELVSTYFNFSPALFVLDENSFSTALANNPYGTFEGKFVHFYLHAPNGIGRSNTINKIALMLKN
ncbi:MAG: DUF1697 domain-containing protein [Colwellia sp.]|nr:DUF1697 domain-containing protein [Colwellia sp.]